MRLLSITLAVLWAVAPAAAMGQTGLSFERAAGLGLKSPHSAPPLQPDALFGGAAVHAWQAVAAGGYALYGEAEDIRRLGLRAVESQAGIVYSRGVWASSFEVAHAQISPLAPRRYALSGQLHTALGEGRSLSVGLQYRLQDTDAGWRPG